MIAKEKAMELVEKYENIVPMIDGYYSYEKMIEEHFNKSKQCALLLVEQIINNYEEKYKYCNSKIFWEQVKKEIDKL
jgi:hypothetical protein